MYLMMLQKKLCILLFSNSDLDGKCLFLFKFLEFIK